MKIKVDPNEENIVNEGVPKVQKYANYPYFKTTTLEFDEEMMVIKQLLCDEDDALKSTQYEPLESKREKKKAKSRQLRKL